MLNKIIQIIESKVYHTKTLGLARSLLAMGLALTLIFSDVQTLFPNTILNSSGKEDLVNIFSIVFSIIPNIEFAKYIIVLLLITIITGLSPRYTCILHFWITYSFSTTSHIVEGGDQIATIITFLLIPICITDNRTWHWAQCKIEPKFYVKTINFYALLLIKIQVFVIYFHACIGKINVDEWVNGTALYYWFNHNAYGAPDYLIDFFNFLFQSPLILFYATWSVILAELSLAISILIPSQNIKNKMLYLGLFLHFIIIFIHGLVTFFLPMASILILVFISDSKLINIPKYSKPVINSV